MAWRLPLSLRTHCPQPLAADTEQYPMAWRLPPSLRTHWLRVLRAKWPLTAVPCDQYVFVQPRVISVHSYYLTSWLPPHSADWRFHRSVFIPHSQSFHFCPFMRDALTGWNLFQSINRLAVSSEISGIRFSLITLNNSTSLLLFRKNGGRKSFLYERCFPFVTIYYHDFFSFSSRNVVQSI